MKLKALESTGIEARSGRKRDEITRRPERLESSMREGHPRDPLARFTSRLSTGQRFLFDVHYTRAHVQQRQSATPVWRILKGNKKTGGRRRTNSSSFPRTAGSRYSTMRYSISFGEGSLTRICEKFVGNSSSKKMNEKFKIKQTIRLKRFI